VWRRRRSSRPVSTAGSRTGFAALRDQRRRAVRELAHVDVFGAIRVAGDQGLVGREEDLEPVGAAAAIGSVEGIVAPNRPRGDLASHVNVKPGVKRALVDVDPVVGIAGNELFRRREEDRAAVGGGANVVCRSGACH
jgi:hypothetical protein